MFPVVAPRKHPPSVFCRCIPLLALLLNHRATYAAEVTVTRLDDDGPGSLRAASQAPRTAK